MAFAGSALSFVNAFETTDSVNYQVSISEMRAMSIVRPEQRNRQLRLRPDFPRSGIGRLPLVETARKDSHRERPLVRYLRHKAAILSRPTPPYPNPPPSFRV